MGVRHGKCDFGAAHNRCDGVGAVPFGIRCACHGDLVADYERVGIRQRCCGGRARARSREWHRRPVIDRERHRSASRHGEASGEVAAGVAYAATDICGVRLSEGVVGGEHVHIGSAAVERIAGFRVERSDACDKFDYINRSIAIC